MRLTYKAGLLGLALLGLLAAPSFAQETPADQMTRLMQFAANNQEFDGIIEDHARELFKLQVPECTAVEKVVRQLPTPYGELAFPADPTGIFPYPNKGVWVEHVKAKACNRIWTINMLAVSRADAKPLLLALLPGETRGDPASQRAAERIGAIAIKKADAEDCADDARATYTKLLGYRQADGSVGKTDANAGWFEEWTYNFCSRDIPAQMAFLPNDKGGYDIKARIVPSAMPKVPTAKPAADAKPATPAAPAAN